VIRFPTFDPLIDAYVINLNSRPDRWSQVQNQTQGLDLNLIRVQAIDMHENKLSEEIYVPTGVSATWRSHQLAMLKFYMESSDSHALILEDDFLLPSDLKKLYKLLRNSSNFDFLQLGYLINHPFERLDLLIKNLQDYLLKALAWLAPKSRGLQSVLGSRLLIKEQYKVAHNLVLNDIRAGGQAYIVSRQFALASQQMNRPVFLSADGMFMSLGETRTFRMARSRKNLITQSNSPSSVLSRFNLDFS
jgi:GR25 family glycosyltransferase involved in LPS biosynthesis